MITKIEIENYKSIRKLTLELGRMNVFIGENGCGKTNILEAIALGSAASRDKLDNEYLVPRGIRVTKPELMRSALAVDIEDDLIAPSVIRFDTESSTIRYRILSTHYRGRMVWVNMNPGGVPDDEVASLASKLDPTWFKGDPADAFDEWSAELQALAIGFLDRSPGAHREPLRRLIGERKLVDFAIYSVDEATLRQGHDSALMPLGVRGEGLFDHLQDLASQAEAPAIAEINEHLAFLDWFERLEIPSREMAGRALRIRDRYLAAGVVFDQKSANEGFLFLLFYLTLFISPHTPRFFAVDNVDASLNPKLCQALMASMVKLAKAHDKQAIVTTHNPSLLDGLDLNDDDQRLFVVSRDDDGSTQVHRVPVQRPLGNEPPIRLSTSFLRGYIGGMPKNF